MLTARALEPRLVNALFGRETTLAAFRATGRGDRSQLGTSERASLGNVAPTREATFIAGRVSAHSALRAAGFAVEDLPPTALGPPAWPEGTVGSIAHTDGYAIAAAGARDRFCSSIGIDVEVIGAAGPDLADTILTPGERAQLAALGPSEWRIAATKVFCAKEAFYKAQFVLTQRWLDFQDVEVRLGEDEGELNLVEARNTPAAWAAPVRVGWAFDGDVQLAGIVLGDDRTS